MLWLVTGAVRGFQLPTLPIKSAGHAAAVLASPLLDSIPGARARMVSSYTLEEALAWCLVWLMAPEIGISPFVH